MTNMPLTETDLALEREALRVYRRYAEEFIEALNLCPWAARSRAEGHVEPRVLLQRDESADEPLRAIAELAAREHVEVGLLLFPRLHVDRREFERFVARLRTLDQERLAGASPPLILAAFHPDAEPQLDGAYRLVPFIRRSPDPTIQLVRRSVIDAVRKPGDRGTDYVDPTKIDILEFLTKKRKPPLHERVAQANLETILDLGVERAEAILRSIQGDRDASYARLGEPARVLRPATVGP